MPFVYVRVVPEIRKPTYVRPRPLLLLDIHMILHDPEGFICTDIKGTAIYIYLFSLEIHYIPLSSS